MPPRPRGRPRTFDPQAALRDVTDVFWAKGFAATSLDDLTAATGLNRPNLYGAFGDKSGMYRQALAGVGATMQTAVSAALGADAPLRARLGEVFDGAIAAYTARGEPRGCLVMCTAPSESPDDPGVRIILSETIDALDRAFEAALSVDGFPAPETRARALTALMQSVAIRARAGVPAAALRDQAAAQLDLLLG